jgi:hypothetical protein
MTLAKTITPNERAMNSHPGVTTNTGKSKAKRETLAHRGETISPPTLTTVDVPHPGGGSPHNTAATDAKKTPEVDVMPGVRSDQTDPSTDITDNYICTN